MSSDPFATHFAALDWAIVAVYLAGALVVGIVANRFIHSVSAYLVGGGHTGSALNVCSFIGTGLGLVTLMYASIEGFTHGFAYMVLPVIGFAMGLIIGVTGLVIRPLRRQGLLTITEFFEHRFGPRTRVLAGAIAALAGIVNMGLFPRMGATFITYSTGLGDAVENPQTLVHVITSLLIVLVLAYTILGGMVSVIVTDYVQFLVLSVGMAVAMYFCLTAPSLGWDRMLQTIADARGEAMFNPLADGGYGPTWVGFQCVVVFVAGFAWAPEATRALTARSPAVARRTFYLSAPAQFARLAIPAFWGIAAFTLILADPQLTTAFFPRGLDAAPENPAAAMPLALGRIVPSGLLGLLVAGLLAAFMSTHDSYLLSWSSIIVRDVVNPLRRRSLSDRQQIRLTRICVLLIGAFLLVWGVWYELPPSVWNYMAISGAIYLAGAGVALLGGCYWKRASSKGAVAAMLTGLIAIAGLFPDALNAAIASLGVDNPAVGMPTVGLFTFAACAVVFVVGSLMFPDPPAATPSKTTAPNTPAAADTANAVHVDKEQP